MTGRLTDIAKLVCTDEEQDVLHLHAAGIGRRRGSTMLRISEDAWRWRLASALRKIRDHDDQEKHAA